MKQLLILILAFSLLLSGCSLLGERIKDPVTFYYLRSEYDYGKEDGVIASEEREASGHTEDLSYLLALYLMGPSDEELISPIPRGTRIHTAEFDGKTVTLGLTDTAKTLTDAEFSLACACLTLTCLDLCGAQEVTITSGNRTVTMSRDTLTLFDNSALGATEETK